MAPVGSIDGDAMTVHDAKVYNQAINDAVASYSKGIGSIRALKIKHVVVVEHIGKGTKQEVAEVGDART